MRRTSVWRGQSGPIVSWDFDSDDDYCPDCEEYGQDCGAHVFDDALEVLEELSMIVGDSPVKGMVDSPWVKTRIPKTEFL